MSTDLTHISFTDGADIVVVLTDGHVINALALDIQQSGVFVEFLDSSGPGDTARLFVPYHFIQTINERY